MLTALKETFAKKNKMTLIMGIILAAYIILVALGGTFGNLINAYNFLGQLGTASNIIELFIMILASLAFTSSNSRTFLDGLHQKGIAKPVIFIAQLIHMVVAYLFFMIISVILTLLLQVTLFKGADMSSMSQFYVAIYANAIHMFIMAALIIFVLMIFSRIKGRMAAIATGIGVNYVGLAFAWIGFLFVYHHRMLKWEPFNFLMVENQLVKPINHTLTKLYMNEAITGSIIYGIVFLILAFCLFSFRKLRKP
ncbi:hypothetical protein [Nicoliella lavandulae]|uniref:ABC transporter permease n=1 Tax=Nicoliella lavandulae TaxID=3082954 RepID=A0ABU8SIW5_9LACO